MLFNLASLALLIVFVYLNWALPRSLGILGLPMVHLALVVCYFTLACISISIGRYDYDGFLSALGLAIQAFAINCLLLPIALVALWRSGLARNRETHMDSPETSCKKDNAKATSH